MSGFRGENYLKKEYLIFSGIKIFWKDEEDYTGDSNDLLQKVKVSMEAKEKKLIFASHQISNNINRKCNDDGYPPCQILCYNVAGLRNKQDPLSFFSFIKQFDIYILRTV